MIPVHTQIKSCHRLWSGALAAATSLLFLLSPTVAKASCDPKVKPATFAAFKACVYREPDTGIWIVDGDIPITTEAQLLRFYQKLIIEPAPGRLPLAQGRKSVELIVNQNNNVDDVWPQAQRCGIRYCVSRISTGTRYQQVVDALSAAGQAWSSNAGVKYVHAQDQDNNCTPNNNQVDFDVQVVTGRPFLARAFFPTQARSTRNILIDSTSFSTTPPLTLEGVLRHELGHTIGFRHEHTRPEAGTCFEDNSWRVLTPYDSNSVMHYPQCNGTAGWNLNLSANDIAGSIALYGNAGRCAPLPGGSPFACSLFNDGYSRMTSSTDAIYFRSNGLVCKPDGTAAGTCRKWFGRCKTTNTGQAVNFTVFNDGAANRTAPSDAVYLRQANSACIPDGTASGQCRRWVGQPVTPAGKPAECMLFNDGYTSAIGPTDAIYARGPNQVCMPDGSATGQCRRWFGRCKVK